MKSMKKAFVAAILLLPSLAFAQSVDIIWQGETYVPPFYQGLPLWSQQSEITFVAMPEGVENPETINYTWLRNGVVLGLVSGPGKNSLSFLDTIFSKPITVEVEIYSDSDEFIAADSVSLSPREPSLLVYEKSPLYGFLFNREGVLGYRFEESEKTFAAFPFSFSTSSKDGSELLYRWGSAPSQGSLATYRIPENSSGLSRIILNAENTNFLKQRSSADFLVQFGQE